MSKSSFTVSIRHDEENSVTIVLGGNVDGSGSDFSNEFSRTLLGSKLIVGVHNVSVIPSTENPLKIAFPSAFFSTAARLIRAASGRFPNIFFKNICGKNQTA